MHNDESEDDGSDSGSAGTRSLTFFFEESVGCIDNSVGCVDDSIGCVCGVRSRVFDPTVIYSIGDVVMLVVLVPIGVKSKGGQLIEMFWRPKS